MVSLNDEALVSVILPVFNGADFIGHALESALRQTYRRIEVIVVNDGSTDETGPILDRYAAVDARVRVLTQKNCGVARARNYALAEARGEFIAPLDADDLWDPRKIEYQMRRLMEAGEPTGFVYCWWVWTDVQGTVQDRSPRWKFEGHLLEHLLQVNFTGNASVPLFRRQCMKEAGGYNEALAASAAGGCEDWELVLRVAASHEVAVVPEVLVGYRRRPGSMSTACNTMWRSHEMVLHGIHLLRPHLDTNLFGRASQQFAMYLAGLSFWSGNLLTAIRWGARAGWRLAFRVAPYVLRMLWGRLRPRERESVVMIPGVMLDARSLPESLLPYDRFTRMKYASTSVSD